MTFASRPCLKRGAPDWWGGVVTVVQVCGVALGAESPPAPRTHTHPPTHHHAKTSAAKAVRRLACISAHRASQSYEVLDDSDGPNDDCLTQLALCWHALLMFSAAAAAVAP